MRKFLMNVLSSNGKVSSKRLITLLAFLLMAVGFIGNLIWKYTIDAGIYDSVKWIVLGGLGFTASEQFGNKDVPPTPTPPTDEPTNEQ